ncbi:MAG: hypothetical protein J6S13_04290 [Clostridia bacterium]|nr:hypothetical protein [Clostridia bacterium]
MPLVQNVTYVHEPNDLQCGQAVLTMLSGENIKDIIKLCGTDRETNLKQMLSSLDALNITYNRERKPVSTKADLPPVCILSLETPRCWHWSLYFKGTFFDPEHGILPDFPTSNRKYYWEIIN